MKKYLVTWEDVVKHFLWCDCEVCEADWNYRMKAKEAPDWATHYAEIVETKQHTFRRWQGIPK